MVFEILRYRMMILRKQLKKTLSSAHCFDEVEEIVARNIGSCLRTYKDLLNAIRETDTPMKMTKNQVVSIEIVMDFILVLCPAFLAEMIKSEIDKMKLALINQLVTCRDESTNKAIDDAMMIFEIQPFRYTVWRIFTVDGELILTIISLITTYVLAMVSFAHFFD
ncbi:unnamed protein product [Spodoptera exigua]|nr:unnamed protein product [Spodoptera exigua]